MNKYKRCPECDSPLIEDDNPVFRLWGCAVCGYVGIVWKSQLNHKKVKKEE